ncbi:hypothetical protein ACUIJN_17265 [Metabacillus halosaccharovorans]|uniref:hypothetical protein n=1 Tax=Metabacillus halosaccharovorans TaxID=930124 RepID=UPI002041BAA4|nr:hypothetical protein [Metabacillus halosaccharovorans]MCM3441402.1 hypothetical protein [Metabacillus halosaccharovorans]
MDNIKSKKTELIEKFGLNVRRYRMIRNISQVELGELTEVYIEHILVALKEVSKTSL